MDSDPLSFDLMQPSLFQIHDTTTGAVELFPTVWSAAENLASPDKNLRMVALDQLIELKAPILSPLVAYIIATRLTDPDLTIRKKVVKVLGEVLSRDKDGKPAPDAVYSHLTGYLSQMRFRPIYSILEVAASDIRLEKYAARLLNACPYGGGHLAVILADRKIPFDMRKEAVRLIGLVGYLDAFSVLEKLESRLATKLSGQQVMSFAPQSAPEETELLPVIRSALRMLQSA
ncbi:MAG: hypothetical protein EHM41_16785 [Chloroflexi bacterium]|nr:MAG: hypothetical protein EHM41_16785 [Chloroflexota bacterium]